MNAVTKLLSRLLESYIAVMALAMTVGFVFTPYAIALAPYSTLFLQGIFFFAGLKLDLDEVRTHLKNPWRIAVAALLMLVVFPLAAYPLAKAALPTAAVGVMLLAAMPSGMTVPLFASIAGGSEALALVLTVATSLLAPVTVPFVSKVALGSSVPVDAVGMFLNLLYVIFLPLALAQSVRVGLKAKVSAASFAFKPISLALLGLLITSVVAKNAGQILASLRVDAPAILVTLFAFFVLTHLVGYGMAFGRGHSERVSYAVALSYMNFVTAIYIAQKFFPDPGTVLTTVLAIVPWVLFLIPFRIWAKERGRRAGA